MIRRLIRARRQERSRRAHNANRGGTITGVAFERWTDGIMRGRPVRVEAATYDELVEAIWLLRASNDQLQVSIDRHPEIPPR